PAPCCALSAGPGALRALAGLCMGILLLLEPAVVETDADTLRGDRVRRHLVPQPALEQHDVTSLGWNDEPRPVLRPRHGQARRGGHEALEARIFELQPGRSLGCFDVVGAAEGCKRMQVQA